jgi:hypothetical protein
MFFALSAKKWWKSGHLWPREGISKKRFSAGAHLLDIRLVLFDAASALFRNI